MTPFNRTLLCTAIILAIGLPVQAATDIALSDVPLDVAFNTANSMFVIDDSASMDYEILLDGYFDGVPFWNSSTKAFSTTKIDGEKIGNLFPTGASAQYGTTPFFVGDGRANASSEHVIPPIPDYMYLRSSDYNPLYYNPNLTYTAWPNGAKTTFTAATPTAARTHPYYSGNSSTTTAIVNTGTATTFDLTSTHFSQTACSSVTNTASDYLTFQGRTGMTIPITLDPGDGITRPVCYLNGSTWTALASTTLTSNVLLAVPYRPASFFMKSSSCTSSWPTCVSDPDGNHYKRYDINSMSYPYTLPDGTVISRTKAEELQNFANWFTYYRNRKLLMAASMGRTIDGLQDAYSNFVAGAIFMHQIPTISTSSPTLYNFTSTDTSKNGRALADQIYQTYVAGGTPTYSSLKAAALAYGYGSPFTDETALRCTSNNTMIVTDGYVSESSYGGSNSLYSVAKQYYDDLRWWKPNDNGETSGNRGETLHTYGVALGAKGVYFGNQTAEPTSWPTPVNNTASAIDDLWHAAIYSKGQLLSATDASTLDSSLNTIIASMYSSGSYTSLTYSSTELTSSTIVMQSAYNSGDWSGELTAFPVILTGSSAGTPNYDSELWSAKALLDKRKPSSRLIATSLKSGSTYTGTPFTASALSSVLSTFNSTDASDGANVINYLRGERSLEGVLYRKRGHLLGDIVDSSPVLVSGAAASYSYTGYAAFKSSVASRKKVVYVGANDGMLHAFSGEDGSEMWAYVPNLVHDKLNALTKPAYTHQFTVDGKLTTWDVQFADGTWHTVLLGGLRKGGKGFYALDITSPEVTTETALSQKVLWEFTDTNMGYSYGKPVIAKTKSYGWVAILTSGYNNADGLGHLYVVNIETGALIKDIATSAASNGSYDQVGLARVVGMIDYSVSTSPQKGALIKYVYGGDLNGNLWRFNLSNASKDNWSVKTLATGLNSSGATTGQPITAAPDVGLITTDTGWPANQPEVDKKTSRLMVFVGNGKLLAASDLSMTATKNGFYAIEDADDDLIIGGSDCKPVSKCLMQVGLGQTTASNGFNNWGTSSASTLNDWWRVDKEAFTWNGVTRAKRGWYLTFSETGGEMVIEDPIYYNGLIIFSTVSAADTRFGSAAACEKTYSAQYVIGAAKGSDSIRINEGFGILSASTLVTINGQAYVTSGTKDSDSDGQANAISTALNPTTTTSSSKLKRFGWREIYR